jgi:hypothetical protein
MVTAKATERKSPPSQAGRSDGSVLNFKLADADSCENESCIVEKQSLHSANSAANGGYRVPGQGCAWTTRDKGKDLVRPDLKSVTSLC